MEGSLEASAPWLSQFTRRALRDPFRHDVASRARGDLWGQREFAETRKGFGCAPDQVPQP